MRPKLATVNMVKKMIQKDNERKWVDININDSTPTLGTGVVSYLNPIAIGDAVEADREGNQIKLHSIHIKGRIITNSTAVRSGVTCKLAIIRWNDQTNGALPSITNIWDTDDVTSHRYWNNQRSYKIVWEKTFVMRPVETAGAGGYLFIEKYKTWKTPRVVTYAGDTAGIADSGKGSYYLVRICDAGSNQPTWDMSVRCTYTD